MSNRADYQRAYAIANRARLAEYRRAYYQANSERIKAYQRRVYRAKIARKIKAIASEVKP